MSSWTASSSGVLITVSRRCFTTALPIKRGVDLGWPKVILDACRQQATAQALWEMRHQYLLNQVLERLVAIGVHPILFKGTALAYDVYPAPFLRTRGDTDLLVPSDTRDRVAKALETLGFRELGTRADVISGQTSYSWTDPASNQEHTLDLHWRIANSTLLSNLFSYEELRSEARPLPDLSANALAADPVHALVLACMHRAVHKHALYYVDDVAYYGGDRLIWFYDIQLLFSMLSPSQRNEFVELAERKGLRATCLDGIEATRARFHTTIPEAVSGALSRPGPTETASELSQRIQVVPNMDGLPGRERRAKQVRFPDRTPLPAGNPYAAKISPGKPIVAALALLTSGPGRVFEVFTQPG